MKLPDKPSESFKRANPHLYPVGGLEANQPQPTAAPSLASRPQQRTRRKAGLACIVNLVAMRKRLLDDDNNVASFKPLRDGIAKSLKLDDGDKRIRWEYGQQLTTGQEGVIVKVQGPP